MYRIRLMHMRQILLSLPDGRRITEQDLRGAGAAVYVISRISGEGKDRRLEEGDYYLSVREREDLLYLDRFQIPLILILNSGGPVELTDILQETENIGAVLNISQPGQEGGRARRGCTLRQGERAGGETDGDVGEEI